MGHRWSDPDPEKVRKKEEHLARWSKIRKELENISLSKFIANDIPLLLMFFGPNCDPYRCSKRIFELIEKRLMEIKK